ncbi:hypothetical protein FJ987_25300 [Mesorhizobium sp. CU2]|uniref:hypothetical protein n=1 Tax=unclassified Mesorhizobium TaxID=325217 RepID=UPI0011287C66|nr:MULTISPECIES: hypothetical protein [unclassified Mesorhizobium]TPN81959.1 hypothetical protein FJ988_17355 [Mesorhizobium sp. CU3]TPO06336.1 hypothetical protein FJ987_25300 [Mesorhizobium sp. CU2]
MPRYATLITGDDGAEIVSAIGEFESSAPPHRASRVEQVAPGVRIGMVRGGPLEAVGGFGFARRDLDRSSIQAVTARLKAVSAPLAPKPVRAKPRRKAVRKKPRAAAKAPASDAAAHG